jgi:hypothetical protein
LDKAVRNKRLRFLTAVTVSALVWFIVLLRVVVVTAWTIGVHGNLVPVYAHPIEVMLLTLLAAAVSTWMWRWHKRDRVQQTLSSLDADEKTQLLQHLLLEEHATVPSPKRKRALQDEAPWQMESMELPDDTDDYHAQRAANSR